MFAGVRGLVYRRTDVCSFGTQSVEYGEFWAQPLVYTGCLVWRLFGGQGWRCVRLVVSGFQAEGVGGDPFSAPLLEVPFPAVVGFFGWENSLLFSGSLEAVAVQWHPDYLFCFGVVVFHSEPLAPGQVADRYSNLGTGLVLAGLVCWRGRQRTEGGSSAVSGRQFRSVYILVRSPVVVFVVVR